MVNSALQLAIRSADHLLVLGRMDAAATILENYLFAYPPAAPILTRLGRIRLEQGRSQEAAELLKRALACNGGEGAAGATPPVLLDQAASGEPPGGAPGGGEAGKAATGGSGS